MQERELCDNMMSYSELLETDRGRIDVLERQLAQGLQSLEHKTELRLQTLERWLGQLPIVYMPENHQLFIYNPSKFVVSSDGHQQPDYVMVNTDGLT
jgi:hypothetical protein